ncbi:hypothetical protein, partial [Maribacter sp. ACAM166]|uniref:hypothetical protein n=1 Tax=Maribacter sp. ACAM166 TaxID=2508996 RepID=UPI001485ADE9
DNTDDQTITTFSLDDTTDVLTLTLEDGGTQTVDFTTVLAAAGTDDQTATEVTYNNATSGLSSTDTQAAIDELKADVDTFAAGSGQTNTASNVGATGVGTFARKTGADLEFKNITAGSNKISITNDSGNDEIDVDINEANLTIIESQISDLTHTVDTDDQTAIEVSIADAAGNFTSIEVEGALAELAVGSTDDQGLSLAAGNILTLEDGGTVNLSTLLDNTDDQTITTFSLDDTTDVLTLTLEDGG